MWSLVQTEVLIFFFESIFHSKPKRTLKCPNEKVFSQLTPSKIKTFEVLKNECKECIIFAKNAWGALWVIHYRIHCILSSFCTDYTLFIIMFVIWDLLNTIGCLMVTFHLCHNGIIDFHMLPSFEQSIPLSHHKIRNLKMKYLNKLLNENGICYVLKWFAELNK